MLLRLANAAGCSPAVQVAAVIQRPCGLPEHRVLTPTSPPPVPSTIAPLPQGESSESVMKAAFARATAVGARNHSSMVMDVTEVGHGARCQTCVHVRLRVEPQVATETLSSIRTVTAFCRQQVRPVALSPLTSHCSSLPTVPQSGQASLQTLSVVMA